jgi:RepB DNA-primase from phage plasmid
LAQRKLKLAFLSAQSTVHPIAAFDSVTIRNHVELLHQSAEGCDGKFVVSVFNDGSPGAITHHRVGEIEGMFDAIRALSATHGANVYTGLHLMRSDLPRGKRGGKADIVAVLGLVADMDADTGKIGTMPVTPSLVIETSPGNTQPVILFDHAVAPEKAETLAKALQIATASDSGTGDIAHVWRIPGTLNYPNAAKIARGRSSAPVAVLLQTAFVGEVHGEEKLTEILLPFIAEPAASGPHADFTTKVDTAPLWQRLTDIGRAVLTADGQSDRSAHAARVVEQLHFEELTLDEAVSLCLDRPGKWTEYRSDDSALIKDIERCWKKFAAPKDAEMPANAEAVERLLHNNDNDPAAAKPLQPTRPPYMANPFDLDAPGGMVSKLAHWIYGTSPSPIAEFSIMSAVVLHAALYGRKYVTPDGLGLNIYAVLIAGSGFGKDRPLKAMKQIATSINRGYLIGPNDVSSDSAIEYVLRHHPCLVLPLDEFGMVLSASGKMADPYARARRKSLLELFSSSTSDWVAKVRAADAGKKDKPPKSPIICPTLSVLGATTPSTFYNGLEGEAFSSGLMARLLVISVDKLPLLQSIDGVPEVPEDLVADLKQAMAMIPRGGVLAEVLKQDSTIKPHFVAAGWADNNAKDRLMQVRHWAREIGIADERRGLIVNRAGDYTSKLATIRAISRDPSNTLVRVEDIEWAFGIVLDSIATVEDGADRFMSGSPFEALCKAIIEAVRTCKDPKGLKNAELLRKQGVSQADPRMFEGALNRLLDGTGELKNGGKHGGRGGKGGRYPLTNVAPA